MISPARTEALNALLTGSTVISCRKTEDQKLAERIRYGTLSNIRFLDYCISRYSTKPLTRLKKAPLFILRMSAYQLLFLDRVPASAVVNDAVSLCRSMKDDYLTGYVNAVLRRIAGNRIFLLEEQTDYAVRYSHPDWFVSSLSNDYGIEFTEKVLIANQETPKLRIQVNTLRCGLLDFLGMLQQTGIQVLSVNELLGSVLIESMRVDMIPGFHNGLFYIQDDAARMSVHISGLGKGMRVLDVCAAPGGKSMAAAMYHPEEITACDVNAARLVKCRENFQRLSIPIRVIQADATVFREEWANSFDLVLADVPCSGTGIIRKEPEIRTKSRSILQELLPLQKRIIGNISQYVKPGGTLIYSTCSVLKEENESQVQLFLSGHSSFSLAPVDEPGFLCNNGMLRSWTHLNGNDGFFAAKLIRQ